ncbi:MAG TPA: carboxypeptidase-like regulatory domain-containing protein [Pirellulales bacterium]|nr:carboxypeptidase-like regulatory domain-containing protein [Pirellulales bacterium]
MATVPVKGKVTYKGQPLADASISFISTAPDGKIAGGLTDAQGMYTLMTLESPTKQANGALPGDYKVTVTKMKKSADVEFQEKVNKMTPEERQKMSPEDQRRMSQAGMPNPQGGGQGTAVESEIPTRYNLPDQSGLTATVKAGQPEVNFDLTE